MSSHPNPEVARRDVLRVLATGGIAAAATAAVLAPAAAESGTDNRKRRARYQANSPDVQNFYRVNRYPKK
jgi:hypothetical protein